MYVVERVFCSLRKSFNNQQSRALEDYVDLALCYSVVSPLCYSTSELLLCFVFTCNVKLVIVSRLLFVCSQKN